MPGTNKTTWVTFYSYKGGVGRTLSMVQTANLLAAQDRKVVLIDFDLEAPGLDSYRRLGVPHGHPGVVEYFAEHLKTQRAPDIKQYAVTGRGRSSFPRRSGRTSREITVIPAGRKDDAYNRARTELNFAHLYETGLGGPLIEEFRLAVEEEFSPDYVLVDSRTGLTDVGGVCTFVLPDIVVLVYAMNRQNVDGIGMIQNAINKHVLEKRKPIELIRVVSPFPATSHNDPRLDRRMEEVRKALGDEEIRVPYRAEFSYQEDHFWIPSRFRNFSLVGGGIALRNSIEHGGLDTTRRSELPDSLASMDAYFSLARSIAERAPRGIDKGLRDIYRQFQDAETPAEADEIERVSRDIREFAEAYQQPAVLKDLARLVRGNPQLQSLHSELVEQAFRLNPLDDGIYEALKRILIRRKEKTKLRDMLRLSFDAAVGAGAAHPDSSATRLVDELGHLSMGLGDYATAVQAFEWSFDAASRRETPAFSELRQQREDTSRLVSHFNLIEARRRAGHSIEQKHYNDLVHQFNKCYPETSRANTADFANKLQAISIPLAVTGKGPQALRSLDEARAIAEIMPEDHIFSVLSYGEESPEGFVRHCDSMIDAIRSGKLWDGMELPVQTEQRLA